MSKLLINLFMLNTKAVVNAYTWSTIPFYTIAQRPWQRLKLSSSFGVTATIDQRGRKVYTRPCPVHIDHPLKDLFTLNETVPKLDRNRKAVGLRDVLSEELQLDETGKPIKIDGKEWKVMRLADQYRWFSVGEILERVDALARGLAAMGVNAGDKFIIYADNSFEWFCTAMALLRLNATTVTLLSILNDEGVLYGTNQSEATYLMASEDLLPRLANMSSQFQHLRKIVYIRDTLNSSDSAKTRSAIETLNSAPNRIDVTTYDKIQEHGQTLPKMEFVNHDRDDIALIMYTSGTTGTPKGVMLTHRNLTETLHNMMHLQEEMKIPLVDTIYAAYLPMAHLYGYILNLGCFFSDCSLALCSPHTMVDSAPSHPPGQIGDFRLLRPQFISTVPLVLDRLLKEIYRKLNARTPVSIPIFNYLMDYKIRWQRRGYDTPITNALLCKKVNDQFGGNLSTMIVGSAPLSERAQALVQAALNVRLIQGYGSTETSVACTSMMTHDLTYGQCGVPLHSAKYYLKDWEEGGYSINDKPNPRGEIVIGGPIIAHGYYKMPEETAEAFEIDQDGTRWFYSGDIGEVLPNGTLKIIDRKKDLVKLPNGEFVSLGKIEAGIRSCYLVENICVCVSPHHNHLIALISPNRKSLMELGQKLGKQQLSLEQLCADPAVIQTTMKSIQEACQVLKFSAKEIPKRIALVKEEWSQDNDLLTAAFKLKRKQVNDYYRGQIDAMFGDNQ